MLSCLTSHSFCEVTGTGQFLIRKVDGCSSPLVIFSSFLLSSDQATCCSDYLVQKKNVPPAHVLKEVG